MICLRTLISRERVSVQDGVQLAMECKMKSQTRQPHAEGESHAVDRGV
jgi:hypothetical protein